MALLCPRDREQGGVQGVAGRRAAGAGVGRPDAGGSAILPAGWSTPGKAGWFIGHVQPNDAAVFNNLATYKWVDPRPE